MNKYVSERLRQKEEAEKKELANSIQMPIAGKKEEEEDPLIVKQRAKKVKEIEDKEKEKKKKVEIEKVLK